MNKTCYKVCLQRKGVCFDQVSDSNTEFVSAVGHELPTEFVLGYQIGQTTTPKVGRIFVFDSQRNAERFLSILGYNCEHRYVRVIFEGLAENVGAPKYLVDSYKVTNDMKDFWQTKKRHRAINHWRAKHVPKGTLTCQAFTPYKEVFRYQR